jgi:hypothetical protein
LPAEIRNLIYDYCIDSNAAQNILQRYYDEIKDAKDVRKVKSPLIWARCPVILLLNKQTYAEASYLQKKRTLTFDHGMLDLLDIKDFISPHILRTVAHINVNDSGHPLFKSNILAASWMGYIELIEQLARHLAPGHNLESFSFTLDHPELVPHVTKCWNVGYTCGFVNTLLKVCRALRTIRGVRSVTLRGLPEPVCTQLKDHMQSPSLSFLDLPAEIRNQIYSDTLDWSDISKRFNRTMTLWTDKTKMPIYTPLTTPTVLVLNRQITSEALSILHNKPLHLTFPADHNMQMHTHVPNTARFITSRTLQHVKTLILEVKSWEWIYSLDYFLPNFTTGTAALKTLHFHFTDNLKSRFLSSASQHYPDDLLHTSLSTLAKIRGLESVTFDGDLPDCYTGPLARIMRSSAQSVNAAGDEVLMALTSSGGVVKIDDKDE